jgi:hypothetical protein
LQKRSKLDQAVPNYAVADVGLAEVWDRGRLRWVQTLEMAEELRLEFHDRNGVLLIERTRQSDHLLVAAVAYCAENQQKRSKEFHYP